MSNFRRWYVPGGTYFFTLVTYRRHPLFHDPRASTLLGDVFRDIIRELPFRQLAVVLLPDHLHALWELPRGDADYSRRWQRIKAEFTKRWCAIGGRELKVSENKQKRGERGIWQTRFWEHSIHDEEDFQAHLDYLHYNPVKHGYCDRPAEWMHSTFLKYVQRGAYDLAWGRQAPSDLSEIMPGIESEIQ